MGSAQFIFRAKNDMGNATGVKNSNTILDTPMYYFMFLDGSLNHYAVKFITENIYFQVDYEVYQYQLMDECFGHRANVNVVHGDDTFMNYRSGRKTRCYTTKGWFLCVMWKDGSDSWVYLKDLKGSNPVEFSEY